MKYLYKGTDSSGKVIEGEIKALNKNKAAVELYKEGIRPDSIFIKKSVFAKELFQRKVKTKEVIVLTKQLEMMLKSGLSLLKSLGSIKDQESNKVLRDAVIEILNQVKSGVSFSNALMEQSHIFSEYYVNMVKAGERAGLLPETLKQIAMTLERELTLSKDVRDALLYPGFVLFVALSVIFLIIMFVIPVFQEMFVSMGSDLPGPTKMVIQISDYLKNNVVKIPLFLLSMIILLKTFYASDKGRLIIDRILFKIPLTGKLLLKRSVSSFAGTMHSMIKSGLTINESLYLSSKTSKNRYMGQAVMEINRKIKEGYLLTEAFQDTGLFSPVSISLITTGYESGSLSEMFKKLSDLLDEEINSLSKNVVKLLEPLIIVVTGAIIAGLIISIYLPVFHLPGTMG